MIIGRRGIWPQTGRIRRELRVISRLAQHRKCSCVIHGAMFTSPWISELRIRTTPVFCTTHVELRRLVPVSGPDRMPHSLEVNKIPNLVNAFVEFGRPVDIGLAHLDSLDAVRRAAS